MFSIDEKRILIRVLENGMPAHDDEINILSRLIKAIRFSIDSEQAALMFPKQHLRIKEHPSHFLLAA